MDTPLTLEPTAPVQRKLLTSEQITDLQRRVLAKEPVSDEELKLGLESVAALRANASSNSTSKKGSIPLPTTSVADRFAAFKAGQGKSAPA